MDIEIDVEKIDEYAEWAKAHRIEQNLSELKEHRPAAQASKK